MAKVLRAAARYPAIARITSQPAVSASVAGRPWEVRNTNALVGAPGWEVLLSKTGYTREAGRCLSMRMRAGERTVTLVLMGAADSAERALDALNVRHWLTGETLVARTRPRTEFGIATAASTPPSAETSGAAATAEGSDAPSSPASLGADGEDAAGTAATPSDPAS
jgi:D-alanyl-D-alanine carboxypeptidase/D-alanyl-D-alanine endopeptidase (penicillin-binding protein 7)